jgi:branched-chain amino acid transport system substrate-binding protein
MSAATRPSPTTRCPFAGFLAALQGGATDGATISANLQSVSEKGAGRCTSYADCAKLDRRQRRTSTTTALRSDHAFDKNGDPTEAYVSIY